LTGIILMHSSPIAGSGSDDDDHAEVVSSSSSGSSEGEQPPKRRRGRGGGRSGSAVRGADADEYRPALDEGDESGTSLEGSDEEDDLDAMSEEEEQPAGTTVGRGGVAAHAAHAPALPPGRALLKAGCAPAARCPPSNKSGAQRLIRWLWGRCLGGCRSAQQARQGRPNAGSAPESWARPRRPRPWWVQERPAAAGHRRTGGR
jgi:hypothetical protein